MHQQAVQAVVRQVVAVAEAMVYPRGFASAGQKVIGGPEPTSCFELTQQGDGLYSRLVGDLFSKHGWQDRFTAAVIRDRLRTVLLDAATQRSTAGIEPAVRKLVVHYAGAASEHLVVLPLVGLTGCREPLRLGRVTLRWYDEAASRALSDRCRAIVGSNPDYTPEWHNQYSDVMDRHYHSALTDRVCAEFVGVSGPERAIELAEDATRQALGLLRYAILFSHTKTDFRAVGLLGEAPGDHFAAVAVRTDEEGCNYRSTVVNHEFDLSPARVERMRANEVFTLSDMACGPPPAAGSMDAVVLRAVHWLASAQTQLSNENALLNLVTCLETFFKAEKDEPISGLIADGVALLTASGKEQRLERRKRVRHFYGKRSKLTHEGDGAVTHEELLEVTLICRDLTLTMVRRRSLFTDHTHFRRWLDEQKFGSQLEYPRPAA